MPPKKRGAASKAASKRKREESSSAEEEASDTAPSRSTRTKRARAAEDEEVEASESAQPTNKVLPVNIHFPRPPKGCVRFATWNISGLPAAQKKGFKYYVEGEDPDILTLTETKVNEDPDDPALTARFPHRYWSHSDKKGYSGTAVLSKVKPLSVDYTLPGYPDPSVVKGRIITLEFKSLYYVGTYVPNAGQGLKALPAKNEWNEHFEKYLRDLDKKKPVIWGGDFNVAPTEIDLSNPKTNWNKTAGYTEPEVTAFERILNPPEEEKDAKPFVDVWRHFHPKDRHYTYFSYRFNARVKHIGWRLDGFVVSERLLERVKTCEIRSEIWGASDHCPVVLEIESDI